ncbi:MAG: inosine/xanthosine triphosphatase [Candidatus Nealsonbacteria bacterium]|nr:inosine/xanthosine triphosphatase [Candidatus Nealsonbacteria bacterium]
MKISVGSKNPVKIAAVENSVQKIWPGAEVIGIEVDSGVSNQPRSNEEAIQGATNRARLSRQQAGADLGIGLEGCVSDSKFGMFVSGWVVAIDKKGEIGIGGGGGLLLPEKVASEIRKGKELGPVMDGFIGGHNTKQKQGTVGVLTNNLIPRTDAFEKSVIFALARFINPHFYK